MTTAREVFCGSGVKLRESYCRQGVTEMNLDGAADVSPAGITTEIRAMAIIDTPNR